MMSVDSGGGRGATGGGSKVGWSLRRILFNRAQCSGVDYSSTTASAINRANVEELRLIFNRYASHTDAAGKKSMTADDFVRKYLGFYQEPNYNRSTIKLIAGAADTTKDGLISFEEFIAFEAILCSPDALYLTAFEMFDTNGSEYVSFGEFKELIEATQPVMEMSFDFDSPFIKRYFGKNNDKNINYLEFTQLLHDFYDEQGKQTFKRYDSELSGSITSMDFQQIMTTVKAHLLTDFVRNNLVAVSGGNVGHKVSYPYYVAFNSLLTKMELMKRIYEQYAKGNLNLAMSQEEFLLAAQSYAHVTPAEVDILFHLAELAHPGQRTVGMTDLERIDPERLKRVSYIRRLTNLKAVDKPSDRGIFTQVLEQMYRFSLGAIGGACGATAVYPIDLVKTRMQNQRTGQSFIGEVMYRNSLDCFKKVVRHEGILGLYRGLLPQIVGVAPEKAIKLTMNDFMRDKLTFQGHLPLWGEVIAGGCGGASQVMFTNPLEIVKIRLQVSGEIAATQRVSVFSILRELGFFGLYKGARACLLRDVPFSAIYFPVYANMKFTTADQNGHNGVASLFGSAIVAGVPAAALVTPADVIKTRLQVAARQGQTTYTGVIDCYRKVSAEEGWTALWKGTTARVFRSAPQFGVTLVAYEMLQRIFYVDFGGSRPSGSEIPAHRSLTDDFSDNPDHLGGYKLAQATFAGIESKFGLFLPRFELRGQPTYVQGSDQLK